MTHVALTIIRAEHDALAAVLRAMLQLLSRHRATATLPDFALLRAMIFYLDEFPEKRHHRQESELLFPKLRARTPLSRPLLDALESDHAAGERAIRELEHQLLGFEVLGETRRAAFEKAASHFASFYVAHMGLEEREILPLAEQVLTAQDWDDLDEAFLANEDPLTGATAQPDFAALLRVGRESCNFTPKLA